MPSAADVDGSTGNAAVGAGEPVLPVPVPPSAASFSARSRSLRCSFFSFFLAFSLSALSEEGRGDAPLVLGVCAGDCVPDSSFGAAAGAGVVGLVGGPEVAAAGAFADGVTAECCAGVADRRYA